MDQLDLKFEIVRFSLRMFTKKLGDTWQYTAFILSFSKLIVYPSATTKSSISYSSVALLPKNMYLLLLVYQFLNDNL